MRVIAGLYKRRTLKTLPSYDIIRPTSDRVKENIFNIISPNISDACIADLFAGTGSLGIEALSRGAKFVVFVEQNKQAIEVIQENLDFLKIPRECYKIYRQDVSSFLRQAHPFTFDIILADPPYASPWYETCLAEIEASECIGDDCQVVIEMSSKKPRKENKPVWIESDEQDFANIELDDDENTDNPLEFDNQERKDQKNHRQGASKEIKDSLDLSKNCKHDWINIMSRRYGGTKLEIWQRQI